MGKYADKYVSLPKFEGDAKPGDIVSLIAIADAEIAKLQCEKAELEKEVARLDEIVCEDALLKFEHTTLVERVKVHNKQFEDGIALYEGRPELQFVQALLSKNLISLD